MYWTTVEKTIVCPVWEVRWGKCIPLLWLYVSKWTRSIIYVGTCSAFSQLCTHFSFVLWVYVFCKPKLKNSNFFPALDREVECPQVDGPVLRRCVCCCLASQGAQWWGICRLMQEAQEMQVWISGAGRSPGRGHGNPLQYSCLKNSLDRGALWATVHGVTKSWTQLNTHTPLEPQECRRLPYTFQMLPSS